MSNKTEIQLSVSRQGSKQVFNEEQQNYNEFFEDQYQSNIPLKESLLHKSNITIDSNNEIPQELLSGDENDEKGIQTTSMGSNYFNQSEKKGQNIFYASITVMKTIVGSGILGLPNVMKNWGIGMGTGFFIFIFLVNQYTVALLLKAKNISQRSNLSTLGQQAFGQKMKFIINIIVVTNNIGICMIEMVIFGTTGSDLLASFSNELRGKWYTSFEFLTFCSAVLISPLIFVKSIKKLRHVALLAIASIFFFAVATIVTFSKEKIHEYEDISNKIFIGLPDNFQFATAMSQLPVLFLAFSYQFNLYPIYKSVDKPSDKRGKLVSFLGLLASLSLYLVVAIMGYLSYGQNVKVNYLQSLKQEHLGQFLYIALNMSFVVSTIFSFPIIFFGARNNLLSLISDTLTIIKENKENQQQIHKSSISENVPIIKQQNRNSGQQIGSQDSLNMKRRTSRILSRKNTNKNEYDGGIQGIKFYLITSAMYITAVTVAIVVGDIDPIFNIIGSIDATSISYLLPTAFYIKLSSDKSSKKKIHYYFSCIIFIFASLLALTCLVCNYIPKHKVK